MLKLGKRLLSISILVHVLTSVAVAGPGELDVTFGGTGEVRAGFGGGYAAGQAAAVQSDGKLVMAGVSSFTTAYDDAQFSVMRVGGVTMVISRSGLMRRIPGVWARSFPCRE